MILLCTPVEMQAALLSHEPRQVDDLIRTSDLPTTIVMATLTTMELRGMIKLVGGM